MATSIGSTTFHTMRGRVQPMAETARLIERPGLDGDESQQMGKRGPIAMIETTRGFEARASAESHITTCRGMQAGDLVTITYPDAGTTANVFIDQVQCAPIRYTPLGAGEYGGKHYICRIVFHCHQTVEPD